MQDFVKKNHTLKKVREHFTKKYRNIRKITNLSMMLYLNVAVTFLLLEGKKYLEDYKRLSSVKYTEGKNIQKIIINCSE